MPPRRTNISAMQNRLLILVCFVAQLGCERSGTRNTEPSDGPVAGSGSLKSIAVAGNVHMLMGKGGNIGLSVGTDGALIVDDQFANAANDIRAAIKALTRDKLAFVLNTHHHGDHTGGNAAFGANATIIAHQNARVHLIDNKMSSPGLPVITFDDRMSVHFNGEEIRLVHFANGHTDGDVVVFFTKSNVVHTGDHFFNGRFPFVDIKGGGNAVQLAKNVEALIEQLPAGVKIIPGHGELATIEDIRRFHSMLVDTINTVRQYKTAGLSIEDAKKRGVSAKWDSWGKAYVNVETWIEIIYTSLD